ncbi:MAG: DUF4860 domain-containing protein, partial [Erysipelotrichaceae bacterium]|nr:DUF4860 domain-containing protein [Erysipelotrichaceae bacterium]
MKKNSIYELFLGLLLVCVFVLCSFYIILLGAKSYSDMVSGNNIENTYRVAFDYIRNRINEAKSIDDIKVMDNMLIIDNDDYDVVIYHDDYLKEMMVKDYRDTEVLDGEKIVKIDDLKIEIKDNHIYVDIN